MKLVFVFDGAEQEITTGGCVTQNMAEALYAIPTVPAENLSKGVQGRPSGIAFKADGEAMALIEKDIGHVIDDMGFRGVPVERI